ncbi:MAG TPA: phospholipid carrier-dependent glycosyltransferase, partial [bacterium]|nr:phospholipid carrier-dependent glycosyltransferase [bacterium]
MQRSEGTLAREGASDGSRLRSALAVFLICFAVYAVTNYGGVRPPDSEVVFRVAESLADGRGFSPRDLESWPGFGVATGTGGGLYSIYPPMESLVLVPAVKLGQWINQSGWYLNHSVPFSHYVGNGLNHIMFGAPESDLRPHALRYLVSWFDVLVSALTVVVLYGVLLRLTRSGSAALLVALFYAFGTLAWPYAGSFFSEPLALLFVLVSFYGLVAWQSGSGIQLAVSGIALGLATATHATAALFLPFFAAYLVFAPGWTALQGASGKPRWRAVPGWLAGFVAVMVLLGIYNYARFGSFFESGRNLSPANKLAFVSLFGRAYWLALYHLLLAAGKGLVLFCPAVILGVVAWRGFHRERPVLSTILAAAFVARLLFCAAYKDWHAGFSLGPRY